MISIRRYREGEEDCLRQLCRDTTCQVNVREYGKELVEKWASRLGSRTDWNERVRLKQPLVAEVNGEIVGFAELTKKGSISAFYSHHLWQKKGIGSALLEAIKKDADKLGIEIIQVESSLSAKRFFTNRGFEEIEVKTTLTDGIPSKSVLLQQRRALNHRV